jgi:hypothetical protein
VSPRSSRSPTVVTVLQPPTLSRAVTDHSSAFVLKPHQRQQQQVQRLCRTHDTGHGDTRLSRLRFPLAQARM